MSSARMRPAVRTALLLSGLTAFAVTPAYATPIFPGDTGIIPTVYPGGGPEPPILFDSGAQSFVFGPPGLQVFVNFQVVALLDPLAPHLYPCGGTCLDFALDVELSGGPAGATTTLTSVGLGGFGGANASIDVGYVNEYVTGVAPSGVNRSVSPNSGGITFTFSSGIPVGGVTETMLLRTDLTSWNGTINVGFGAREAFPMGPVFTPSGIASVAAPEPGSLVLLSSGALLAFRRRIRARAR
ncbi:MAG TPA: PEP-CTERM sorting domain-containing protein [Vicinamibacterales bacterium]|nr:PEP-CTERM sorting domain-containing protein [Vicinamibacterales bacterium]